MIRVITRGEMAVWMLTLSLIFGAWASLLFATYVAATNIVAGQVAIEQRLTQLCSPAPPE